MGGYDQQTDAELLERAAGGDEEAFAALYRRRGTAIYRFALGMTGRREAAEEVVQETFLALIEKPSGFDPARGELASYLYGVARNQGLRQFRETSVAVEWSEKVDETGDLAADLEARDCVDAVRRAVLALPEVYREAVVLCDLEELSYAEAAVALEVELGTVRSRLHRGRALLAKKLGATFAPAAKEAR